jgi:hypothetical protein
MGVREGEGGHGTPAVLSLLMLYTVGYVLGAIFNYSTIPQNRNHVNRNHLEICPSSSQKIGTTLFGFCGLVSVSFLCCILRLEGGNCES